MSVGKAFQSTIDEGKYHDDSLYACNLADRALK